MVLWFRSSILLLIIFFVLGAVFNFTLLLKEAQAESVSVSIQVLSVCGDTVIEADEQCEGIDLNSQTCESIGYLEGDLACTASCFFNTSGCVPVPTVGGGAGGGGAEPRPLAKVILKGKAYPNAVLNVLKYGNIVATFNADASGFFEKEVADLLEGTYVFGIWAEDQAGRKSTTLTFPITVFWGMTASINGIFIPPTISLNKTGSEIGEGVEISGEVFPGSDVDLFISPQNLLKKTKANLEGKWTYKLDTTTLEKGNYQVKAKALFEAREESSLSQTLSFLIGLVSVKPLPLPPLPVPLGCGADLNCDDKINLVDFSVLLHYWGKNEPIIDLNKDGKVGLRDFSIMMYWWTG